MYPSSLLFRGSAVAVLEQMLEWCHQTLVSGQICHSRLLHQSFSDLLVFKLLSPKGSWVMELQLLTSTALSPHLSALLMLPIAACEGRWS